MRIALGVLASALLLTTPALAAGHGGQINTVLTDGTTTVTITGGGTANAYGGRTVTQSNGGTVYSPIDGNSHTLNGTISGGSGGVVGGGGAGGHISGQWDGTDVNGGLGTKRGTDKGGGSIF